MKANKKIMDLLNHGFGSSLLLSLNEKQVDSLYQRLEESKKENKEQTTPQNTTAQSVTTTKYTVKPNSKTMINGVEVDTSGGQTTVTPIEETENIEDGETKEETSSEDLALSINDPEMAVTIGAQDMSEKFESKSQQKLFFAKCGDGKTKEQKKWCKMAKEFTDSTKNFSKLPEKKKSETKENLGVGGYNKKLTSVLTNNLEKAAYNRTPNITFGESILKNKISTLVEKHLPPKMNKRDLMKIIIEAEREVETPVKPDVKPERPKPQTPYQPKHQPAPKAKDIPKWLSFGALGINLK